MTKALIRSLLGIAFNEGYAWDYIDFLQQESMNKSSIKGSFNQTILDKSCSKEVRKNIRKHMKYHLSPLDKVKFTRIYEFINGTSYRDSFEITVNIRLNRFLLWKMLQIESRKALLVETLIEMLPPPPTHKV